VRTRPPCVWMTSSRCAASVCRLRAGRSALVEVVVEQARVQGDGRTRRRGGVVAGLRDDHRARLRAQPAVVEEVGERAHAPRDDLAGAEREAQESSLDLAGRPCAAAGDALQDAHALRQASPSRAARPGGGPRSGPSPSGTRTSCGGSAACRSRPGPSRPSPSGPRGPTPRSTERCRRCARRRRSAGPTSNCHSRLRRKTWLHPPATSYCSQTSTRSPFAARYAPALRPPSPDR
jgi:hypothetical protein